MRIPPLRLHTDGRVQCVGRPAGHGTVRYIASGTIAVVVLISGVEYALVVDVKARPASEMLHTLPMRTSAMHFPFFTCARASPVA